MRRHIVYFFPFIKPLQNNLKKARGVYITQAITNIEATKNTAKQIEQKKNYLNLYNVALGYTCVSR